MTDRARNEALLRELLGQDEAERLLAREPTSPLLDGDPAWLEELLAAREDLPLPEVPAVVSQDLRDLFDSNRLQRHHDAVMISDSRQTAQPAGMRGAAAELAGWTLSYSTEAADIVLDITPRSVGPDTVDIDGQVLPHAVESLAFRVQVAGCAEAATTTDELGCFRIEQLAVGSCVITLFNMRMQLVVRADLAGGRP